MKRSKFTWFATFLKVRGSRRQVARLRNTLTCGACIGTASLASHGAEVDVSQLPPASTAVVDYTRDILPIVERSCLRCHGPEKPKGKFRMDSREAILKGGSSGECVVVGNSAASSLIHLVARLKDVDSDSWMPPEGKAPLLTPKEVALFRGWVDQGLPWGTSAPPVMLTYEIAPVVGGTTVNGNEAVFREHHWMPEGWNGGAEKFNLRERIDERTQLTSEGHALRDDYRLTLQVERRDLGFVRGGFEQFRKYYSDSGGYASGFAPEIYSLDRDLHLDLGRAWVELGLTLPHWPRLTLGYEHQYKDGEKSLTSWSPIVEGGSTRGIFPTSKKVDEETHILKFNLDHEIRGLRVEDEFRAEWNELRTSRTNSIQAASGSGTQFLNRVRESQGSFQAANAFRLGRPITSWMFASGGYLYSHFDADASFSLDESYLSGSPGFSRRWRSPGIVLDRDAHVANLNGQFGPWDGFVMALGAQGEWSQQRGLGEPSLDFEASTGGFTVRPAIQKTAVDRVSATEYLNLSYVKIPNTVLFAEGRLQQEDVDLFEDQSGVDQFRRDTDTSIDLHDIRGGFSTSPWSKVSLSANYRWIEKRTRYHDEFDILPTPFGDFPGDGYSAFIRGQEKITQGVEARLSYHWSARLKTILTYRRMSIDYWTTTDPMDGFDQNTFQVLPGYITPGTRKLTGNYDANIYSFNSVVRPADRISLSGTFSFQDNRSTSAANNSPSVAAYRGHLYSVLANGSYAWNPETVLLANYSFSYADYKQGRSLGGLPLGIVYEQHGLMAGVRRRITDQLSATLRYGFFLYDEPTSGGFNNYMAHSVFGTLNYRFR